jgi:hypothetical protein
MYFFGYNKQKNDDIIIDIIDIDEEKRLIGEEEEIITYDDLNISKDNIIYEASGNMLSIPRPTLVIPKSPANTITKSSSDEDEIYNTSGIDNASGIDVIIHAERSPIIKQNMDKNNSFIESRCAYYTINTMLCGVLLYVLLAVSGATS